MGAKEKHMMLKCNRTHWVPARRREQGRARTHASSDIPTVMKGAADALFFVLGRVCFNGA